jgi:hypothetical protein
MMIMMNISHAAISTHASLIVVEDVVALLTLRTIHLLIRLGLVRLQMTIAGLSRIAMQQRK